MLRLLLTENRIRWVPIWFLTYVYEEKALHNDHLARLMQIWEWELDFRLWPADRLSLFSFYYFAYHSTDRKYIAQNLATDFLFYAVIRW